MLKDFMEFLSGTKMTVISAFFLLASLCFMLTGTKAFPDPVWGTIFISGTPIIYKALKKLFFCRCISSPLLLPVANMQRKQELISSDRYLGARTEMPLK